MKFKTTLSTALLSVGGKTAPTEFLLMPRGDFQTTKGTFLVDDLALASVLQHRSEWGVDCLIDYEHQSENTYFNGQPVPAAGWIKALGGLEARAEGLFAVGVEWTDKAKAHLEAGEYRYHSPTIGLEYVEATQQLRVRELYSVALTNTPASVGQAPLVLTAMEGAGKDHMKFPAWLLASLGLSVAQAVTEDQVKTSLETLAANAGGVTKVLELTGATTLAQAEGTLVAWKASHEALPGVRAELSTLQGTAAKSERDGLITEALRTGKLTPALKPWAETVELSALKAYLAAAPTLVPNVQGTGGTGHGEPPASPTTLTAADFAKMAPREKHALYTRDPELYETLRAAAQEAGKVGN